MPNQPPAGPWSSSPDIVFAGKLPANSAQYVTPQGYATDYGGNVFTNVTNFVYPRALNAQGTAGTGRVWFFWTDSSVALWPQNWRGDLVTVSGQSTNHQPLAATAGNQICVVNQPFEWTPPTPMGSGHYITITWVENNPTNPPVNPFQGLAPFPTYDALVQFVTSHPNMGVRGVITINGLAPTWTETVPITGPSPAQMFYLGIQCTNIPVGGQVGFVVPGPTPAIPPIIVPTQVINSPNLMITVPVTGWPSGAQSSMTIVYQQGATPPPPGASISAVMFVAPAGSTKAKPMAF
ncbi:hypothetical protein [Bradyrhizobium sp. ORS 285]|uniref:hypothetical protein n=1 Tax=Bradyrhizobium sp. ORS 285 TaxID=115808 RepID=UPI0011126151|nr:hypothetical protein [Bradyrhizobium sp. ORS 285]